MSNDHNEEYEFDVSAYEFTQERPDYKSIDMKLYFDIDCSNMPITHINATYSLLHKIMKDDTLEEDTRQDLIKILLNFDYGNREIREQLQKALSSFNQNRESRPMYENENMHEDSV